MGVNFFIRKKTIPGGRGGPRGGLAKDHKKYVFFFRHPSLTKNIDLKMTMNLSKIKTKTKTKAKIKTKTGSWLGDEGARWAIAVVVSPCKGT